MRTIKFRAWDGIRMTTSGVMFNNTTGGLEVPNDSQMKLMQFTGLLDKNGKEIYEGDIVNVYVGMSEGGDDSLGRHNPPERIEYQRTVEWIDSGLNWKGSGLMMVEDNTKYFEVIGNIYEDKQ